MSGTQHTPGLLVANGCTICRAINNKPIAETRTSESVTQDVAAENARRLAAAWNACHGINTENIEDMARGLNFNNNGEPVDSEINHG